MSAFGTPVITTAAQSSTSGSTITATINTTTGDLIVVFINITNTSGISQVQDTIGNTYTRLAGRPITTANAYTADIYYCLASVGTNASNVVTATKAAGANLATGMVIWDVPISSGASASFDVKSGTAAPSFGNLVTSPTVTTTGADEFVAAGAFVHPSGAALVTFSAQSGYTLDASQLNNGSGDFLTTGAQHNILSATQSGYAVNMTFSPTGTIDAALFMAAFKAVGGSVNVSHSADAYIVSLGTKTHSADASVVVPATVSKNHNVDCHVAIVQIGHSVDVQVVVGGLTVLASYVKLAGAIVPKINPANIIKLASTLAFPGRQYVQLTATLRSPSNISFVNLAGFLQSGNIKYIKLAGTLQNPTYRIHSVDANITSGATRAFVKLTATLKQPLVPIVAGAGFPNNSWIKLAATLVTVGGSKQMPGAGGVGQGGFTAADDWNSSQDALTSYKPTSIFNISGATLPAGGINLIVTAFTCGVVSSQTRTRSWLRLVDAAPGGVVVTTAVATHTLPNGAVITTTTTTTQNQDSTTVTTVIQNSATPQRTSTIQTIKYNSGQTITTETDQTNTNGEITTTKKKNVTSAPPIAENIQPLQVRTLDGIIHYQFFVNVNQDWAGGEQEGLTSSSSAVTINGDMRVTVEDVTTPDGKNIHTVTEEVIPVKDIGTVLTTTTESFTGSTKTVNTTTTFPDGTQTISSKITAPNGDTVENTTETVTDEYGQITTTVTKTETVVGQANTIVTKTVNVTKGGVTTTDTVVTTNNNFEDSIVSTKIKVYFLQEFTITCVIDEQSMTALQGINITHQKNYALMELFGQQLGNTQLSWILRQSLIQQFAAANNSIIPVTLQALGNLYSVVFAQAASGFRAKYIPGTEPHVYELQMILQSRSDIVNGTFGF